VLQVLHSGGDRAAVQRRDRPNYGPYLLLLSPEDMAHITLQSECTHASAALHCMSFTQWFDGV
jgi:DNA-directed RNA polymerase